jgi:hypothetical protein
MQQIGSMTVSPILGPAFQPTSLIQVSNRSSLYDGAGNNPDALFEN